MGGSLRLTLISELQASEREMRSCSKEVGGIPGDVTGGLHTQECFHTPPIHVYTHEQTHLKKIKMYKEKLSTT